MATVAWEKTQWCPIAKCFRMLWSSVKTSKEKGLGFYSERLYPFMDYYFNLGNLFIMGFFNHNFDDGNFFFQDLKPGGSMKPEAVAQFISRCLSDLAPASTNKAFATKIPSMPDNVSSGSLRHTAINTMAHAGVTIENMVAVTGHSFTQASALFEYLNLTVTGTVIGEIALSGWPVPTHQAWVKPPPTPTLEPLFIACVVDKVDLDSLMDEVFCLDLNPNVIFKTGGTHRALIECMMATILMRFEYVYTKYPDHECARRLMNAVMHCATLKKATMVGAAALLKVWGSHVKAAWELQALPPISISESALTTLIAGLTESINGRR